MMNLNALKIDPEFQGKIPPLNFEEEQQLEQNILHEGRLLNPIIIWNGFILDGHTRYRILRKHPFIVYQIQEIKLANRYAALSWICQNQLGRRNLDPERKKFLMGKLYESEKLARGGSKERAHDENGRFTSMVQNDPLRAKQLSTCERIAAQNGVGAATVKRAEKYAKGVDAAEDAVPGAREEILTGRIKATDAEITALAKTPKAEIPAALAELRKPKQERQPRKAETASSKQTLSEISKSIQGHTLYRVSTKGQVEKDDIPMQKEACRNFAESQGWEIVKEFSEKGVSGFKKSAKERDELQKIQQAAMEGKFDILLVFMFDRLGRRDDETPFIVEWFTKQGIEVWSVNEGQQRFDTHVDKLMNYIRYWQASGESLKTSVRTRTRLEQLTGEGHYTGGTVPYGYKRVRLGRVNKKNQEVCDLVIDEAEAEIVRLIFHKYVYEGYGAQKLSHYLYEQGVVGRNNKNIPNTSIVRMIKNKGYTGYLINGAVETECPQLRIIEPELFEQAQELRQARTCERGGTSLGTSSKALLTGLVYCAHCGNRLSLTSSGRTHTYADGHTVKEVRPRYSCFYKIRHPGDCDGQSGYGVSKLDSIVEEVVRQIFAQFREVSRKKLLESVKTNDAARIQKKVKKIQKDLEAKQKELDDLKAETILVIRGVSALDKELLGTLVAEAREALETLEKQLVQAQEEYEEATKTAKRSNYICNELFTWADVYDTANHDERRAILQQFIKEIRVRKDYEISITLNASFDQVEQLKAVSTYDGAEIFEEISEKGA